MPGMTYGALAEKFIGRRKLGCRARRSGPAMRIEYGRR
jgi:hypothetical protein